MALNILVERTFPGVGVSTRNTIQTVTGLAITSGTTYYLPGTSTNTVAGLLVPTITVGRVRIKIYNGAGTSPTVTQVQVFGYDGTNSVLVAGWTFTTGITLSTTSWVDIQDTILADTATGATSGGAVGQLISGSSATSGNGGMQCVKIIVTLGGTSPAATMDAEIFGLI